MTSFATILITVETGKSSMVDEDRHLLVNRYSLLCPDLQRYSSYQVD